MKIIYNFLPQQRTHPSNTKILNPIVYFNSANSKAVLTKVMLTYVYKTSQVTERRKKRQTHKKYFTSPTACFGWPTFPQGKNAMTDKSYTSVKAKAHFSVPAFSVQMCIEILLIWIIIPHKKRFLLRRRKSYVPHLLETPKTRLGRPCTLNLWVIT